MREVQAAAKLALYGLPAWRFLTTRDSTERVLLQSIADQADQLQFDLEKRLAVHIANAFVRAKLHG